MPTKKPYVKAYLADEEYAHVAGLAERAGISISSFVRQSCLGQEVRSLVDHKAVLALLQSKADLGRLGGLLKQRLSESGGGEEWSEDLRGLLKTIEYGQRDLARDFRRVAEAYLRGKKR